MYVFLPCIKIHLSHLQKSIFQPKNFKCISDCNRNRLQSSVVDSQSGREICGIPIWTSNLRVARAHPPFSSQSVNNGLIFRKERITSYTQQLLQGIQKIQVTQISSINPTKISSNLPTQISGDRIRFRRIWNFPSTYSIKNVF